jgi:hypothetical protein
LVVVVSELDSCVVCFTTLPGRFFTLVVVFELRVEEVVPVASEAELVEVEDLSVVTRCPSSDVVVLLVVVCESVDCVVCAPKAAAAKRVAISIFMPGGSAFGTPGSVSAPFCATARLAKC